jgi:hypothetical protein
VKNTVLAIVILLAIPVLSTVAETPFSNDIQILMSSGWLTRLPDAVCTVRQERQRTAAEKTAFEQFAKEIKELNCTTELESVPVTANQNIKNSSVQGSGTATESVRSLFEENVMDTAHYHNEYGECPLEAINAELGPDIATSLVANNTISPSLQQALTQASRVAAQQRNDFICSLNSELDSIIEARSELNECLKTVNHAQEISFEQQSFDCIVEIEEELQGAKTKCESVIDSRQTEYVAAPEAEGVSLQEYLYCSYEWTHPVIGDALDIIEEIREINRELATAVSTR